MPGWAQDNPRDFWDAADLYERENGRFYVSADSTLPRGLDEDEQVALGSAFAHLCTGSDYLHSEAARRRSRTVNHNRKPT